MKKTSIFALFLLLLFLFAGCNDPLYGSLPPYEQGYPIFTTLEGEVPVIGSIPSHALPGQTVRILLDRVSHQSYTATLNGKKLAVHISDENLYYEFVMPEGEAELRIVTFNSDVPYPDDYVNSSLEESKPLPPTTFPFVMVQVDRITESGFSGVVVDPDSSFLQYGQMVEVRCDLSKYSEKDLRSGAVRVEFDGFQQTESGYRLAAESLDLHYFPIDLTLEGTADLLNELPRYQKAGQRVEVGVDLVSEHWFKVMLDGKELSEAPGSNNGSGIWYQFAMPQKAASLKISVLPVTYDEEASPLFDDETPVIRAAVSSLPEGYSYEFTNVEGIAQITDYLENLDLIFDFPENPDEYDGMTWVITLHYLGGGSTTVYHFGNTFIRGDRGVWYKMSYEQASAFDKLVWNLPPES